MKEKIKKILTCKDLWNFILEIICGIILLLGGYFSGFANGLLIEDDVRDNMIVEINDLINEDKNKKLDIEIEKKEAIELPYSYNYTYQNINMPFMSTISEEETGTLLGLQTLMSFDLSFDFLIYSSDNIVVNNISIINFRIGQAEYSSLGDAFTFEHYISLFVYSSPIEIIKVDNELFNFDINDNVSFTFPYLYIDLDTFEPFFYIDFIINDNVFTSYFNPNFLYQLIDNLGPEFILYFTFAYDKNVSKPYPIYTLNNSFNILLSEIFAQENGGASQEELEQAYQQGINVGYQSGVIEGKSEFINSQEYRDILKEEFDEGVQQGIQQGIDSANDADGVFDRVFMVIRNAGASFLNLFDFYIFPNMPFYVVIAIPFIISSLFILFKILLK